MVDAMISSEETPLLHQEADEDPRGVTAPDREPPSSSSITTSTQLIQGRSGSKQRSYGYQSSNSFSSYWMKHLSPSERVKALEKPGVGPAAFLIRDAVLGEEDLDFHEFYNPYVNPENEWRNFLALLGGRISSSTWVNRCVNVVLWVQCLLTFVEPPHWCRNSALEIVQEYAGQNPNDDGYGTCQVILNAKGAAADGSEDVDLYPNARTMYLTAYQSRCIEWICLIIVAVFTLLKFAQAGFDLHRFFFLGGQRINHMIQFFAILLLSIGLIFRLSVLNPFLRLALLGSFMRDFQVEFVTLATMIPDIMYILVLLVVVIVFYGWFGVVLFYDTTQGARDFSNLIEGCWTLWICVTTANYPDVMMPSYNDSRLSAIFFVSFMIITFFFLMNLILASVVNAYDAAIEGRRKSRRDLAARKLELAFQLMDEDKSGRIDRETIMALFLILNQDFPEIRTLSKEETMILFGFLDQDGSSTITLDEFLEFGNVLLLEFIKASDYTTYVEQNYPDLFKSRPYQAFSSIVRSEGFEYAIDVLLVLNAIVIGIQSYPELSGQPVALDSHYSDGHIDTIWEMMESIFTMIYVVEVLVKVTVHGWREYRESARNMFDCFITVLALLATAYVYYPNAYSDSRLIRFIVMARVLRLLRILTAMRPFQLIGSISAEILPAAASVLQFLFFLMYFFATLGVCLYGGMITRDPQNPLAYKLLGEGSNDNSNTNTTSGTTGGNDFVDNDYWANNFNDVLSGINVLFNLLVVNNWTNCEIGFEAVTGAKWVRLFFLSFHVLGVILVNNLVIAFIINAFFQQLETVNSRSREDILEGEAVIRGERALFDASHVTGTQTGATGGSYIARIRARHKDIEVDEHNDLRRLFTQKSSSVGSSSKNARNDTAAAASQQRSYAGGV